MLACRELFECLAALEPDEVRNGRDGRASQRQQHRVRDEVRNDHQHQAAQEGSDGALLLAIEEIAEADRAEQDALQELRCRHAGASRSTRMWCPSCAGSVRTAARWLGWNRWTTASLSAVTLGEMEVFNPFVAAG